MEEICPSPVARRLITNRSPPLETPLWSGCGTIEGLNKAADSSEYSPENNAPINISRARDSGLVVRISGCTFK